MSVWHKNDLFVHTLNVIEGVKGDVLLRLTALFHDIGKPKAMSYENTSKGLIRHYYGHPLFSKELTYEIMSEYRYSNIERDTICFLIEYHDHEISPTNKSVKKILNKISDIPNIKRSELELLSDLLDLQISDHNDHAIVKSIDKETIINIAAEIINTRDAFNVKDLDINGNDLQKYGIYGKEIGQTLNTLLELVMDNKIPNKRKDLLEYVKKERNKD